MASEEQFIDFCSSLGIAFDSDRFAVLSRRVTGDARITVIGLVSRGKSTLINQLAGVELCPVDARGETAAIIEISNGPAKTEAQVESGDFVKIGKSVNDFRNRLPRRVVPTVTWARFSGPVRLPPGITLVDTPGIDDASTVDEKLLYLEKHWTKSGAIGALVVLSVPPGMGRSDKELVDSALRVFGNNFEIVLKATDSTLEKDDLIEVRQEVERLTGKRPILLSAFPSVGEWGNSDLAEVENAIDRMSRRSKEIVKGSAAELAEIFDLVSRSILSSNYSIERLRNARDFASKLPPVIRNAVDDRLLQLQTEKTQKEKIKKEEELAKKIKILDNQAKDLVKLLPTNSRDLQVRLHGPAVSEIFKLCLGRSKIAEAAITKMMALPPDTRLQFGLDARQLFKQFPEQSWIDLVRGSQLVANEVIAMVGIVSEVSSSEAMPLLRNFLKHANQDQIEKTLTASNNSAMTSVILETLRKVVVADFRTLIARSSNVAAVEQLLRSNEILQETYRKRLGISSSSPSSQDEIQYARIFSDLEKSVYAKSVAVLNETISMIWRKTPLTTKAEISQFRREAYPVAQKIAAHDSKLGLPLIDILSPKGFLEAWYECCLKNREEAIRHAQSLNIWVKGVYFTAFFLWIVSILLLHAGQVGSVVLWIVSLVMWLATKDRQDAKWEDNFVRPDFNKIVKKGGSAKSAKRPIQISKAGTGNGERKSQQDDLEPEKAHRRISGSRLFIVIAVLVVIGLMILGNSDLTSKTFLNEAASTEKINNSNGGEPSDSTANADVDNSLDLSPVIGESTLSTSATTSSTSPSSTSTTTSSTVPVTTTTIPGGAITGTFRDVSSPTDFYFSISENTYLEFRGYGSEGGVDAMFWLYDANENLLATSDDDIGRDPLLLGNAEPGQFRLRVGVCCSPSTPWVGSYRVTFNVEPNSLPVTTTTVAVTTTTVAVTTTTRPPANPQITSDSLSRSSLVLAPDINSNAVYWTVNMTDSLGRLPGTAGAQLCAPGSSPGIGPWCTGATMSRSGTGFAASYTGLFLISNSADRGSWYPSVFWPLGQASEYQLAGTDRISIS